MALLWALLLLPLLSAAVCALLKRASWVVYAHRFSTAGTVGLGLWIVYGISQNGPTSLIAGWLRMDALSAWLVLIITLVGGWAAWNSISYLNKEVQSGACPEGKLREYYALFHLFWGTMLWVAVSDNLGLLWVSVEATTLSSAFLVAFYNEKSELEAAWKYVILSSVGIALALFGTVLLYFSSLGIGEGSEGLLSWIQLILHSQQLDGGVLKLAFSLALIGYGTKVGLSPMHTWLPDAHSQAPAPISAMLSGVLLSCAFYALLRFHIILQVAGLGQFSSSLLLGFGLFTVVLAAFFMLVQQDYKRLLAYSSIENMGLIAVGVGFNVRWAVFGALLHLLYHALTKALMFLASGFLYLRFSSKRIADVSGVLRSAPKLGAIFFAGAMAISGVPPFSPFMSKFSILSAGFTSGHGVIGSVLLAGIAMVFAGYLHSIGGMVFGAAKEGAKEKGQEWVSLAVLLGVILLFGLYLPAPLNNLITRVLEMMQL